MITVKNLTYQYKQSEDIAVNNVSFTVQKGEWVAIVGHNGSGKSTTAKLLNGLLVADNGEIMIDGVPLNEQTVWDIRRSIGMVFQNPDNQFVGATVEDDVAFGLENHGVDRLEMLTRVEEALRTVEMWDYRDKEPSRLSGGQKQRVAIASVLALQPAIIILDEATAMLDPKGRQMVIDLIVRLKKSLQLTIISITHDEQEAKLADRILVMEKGNLIEDSTPVQLFSDEDKTERMGLTLPFSEKLRRLLKQEGIDVPERYMNDAEMEEFICQFNLTK